MCSFCQSVTLNLSGKENLRGEPAVPRERLGLAGEKKRVEKQKDEEGDENHNSVAFQGHEWHQ